MHRIKEATCVALMLKAGHQIVGISHDDHVAPGLLPSPALSPKVEAVVGEHIGAALRRREVRQDDAARTRRPGFSLAAEPGIPAAMPGC
jgi:hypothetical protein